MRTALLALISTSGRVLANAGTIILLARILAPDQFGSICLSIAWGTVLAIIADWGLAHCAWYELLGNPAAARLRVRRDLRAKAWLTLGYFAAAVVIYVAFLRGIDALTFFAVAVAFHLMQLGDYFCFVLRGIKPISVETRLAAITSGVYAVGVVGAGVLFGSQSAVVCAMAGARLVYAVVAGMAVRRAIGTAPMQPRYAGAVIEELRRTTPVALDIALIMAAGQLDMLLVGAFFQPKEIGIYAGGGRLIMVSSILTASFANVFVPLIVTNRDKPAIIALRTGQLLAGLTGLGLLAIVGFILAGPLIVRYVYGPAYAELNQYWGLFGSLVCLQFWAGAFGILLNSYGFQTDRAAVQIVVLPLVALAAVLLLGSAGIPGMILIMLFGTAASGYGYCAMCARRRLLAGVGPWILAPVLALAPLLLLFAGWRFLAP